MPEPARITDSDRETLAAVIQAVLGTTPEHTGADGAVTRMSTPIVVLPMYCAICARNAALHWARSDLSEGGAPLFIPVALGHVKRLPDGSYEVPIARGAADGNSMCMPHLLMPDMEWDVME